MAVNWVLSPSSARKMMPRVVRKTFVSRNVSSFLYETSGCQSDGSKIPIGPPFLKGEELNFPLCERGEGGIFQCRITSSVSSFVSSALRGKWRASSAPQD